MSVSINKNNNSTFYDITLSIPKPWVIINSIKNVMYSCINNVNFHKFMDCLQLSTLSTLIMLMMLNKTN